MHSTEFRENSCCFCSFVGRILVRAINFDEFALCNSIQSGALNTASRKRVRTRQKPSRADFLACLSAHFLRLSHLQPYSSHRNRGDAEENLNHLGFDYAPNGAKRKTFPISRYWHVMGKNCQFWVRMQLLHMFDLSGALY